MSKTSRRPKARTAWGNPCRRTDGGEFLGFVFEGFGGQIRVSAKKIKKFKDRVREITRRKRGVSMSQRYQELGGIFEGGWRWYDE